MKDYYVILTGGKNNAGDFLIKFRAKQLFASIRPDRCIVDFNAWEAFTPEQLEEVNHSRALILIGGPALQSNMRPDIYKMTENLHDINIPIIAMGIGWKSQIGDWASTHHYKLNKETIGLLQRIEESGYSSSVRDYHTLNTLFTYGFKNFVMSGCPALYSLDHLGQEIKKPEAFRNVSFSMGVGFVRSVSMRNQTQSIILKMRDFFNSADFKVVFHHSIGKDYLTVHGSDDRFWEAHQEMITWLSREGIPFVDVSGSAENLVEHYSGEDIHIGYRVHAHIFMSSISKPSVLINEDGRGKALKDVIGGFTLDAYQDRNLNLLYRILNKMRFLVDTYKAAERVPEDLEQNIRYEMKNDFPRLNHSRKSIDRHFKIMKSFIEQLP